MATVPPNFEWREIVGGFVPNAYLRICVCHGQASLLIQAGSDSAPIALARCVYMIIYVLAFVNNEIDATA